MIPENEPDIKREDGTASIIDQAEAKGWSAGFYHFGKGEQSGVDFFNPGLVQRPDGLWLMVRRSEQEGIFGKNNIWAFELDETGKIPKWGRLLEWPKEDGNQQFEDARAVYHPGLKQTFVGACTFVWYGDSWTGAIQVLGIFNDDWECRAKHYPLFDTNAPRLEKVENVSRYQKNWTWFFHEGKLHLHYKSKPWIVTEFGETWEDQKRYQFDRGAGWKYGDVRGGTPPVLVGNHYFTFMHSSLPWQGHYRRYYAGCVAFESEPPFRPVMITTEPLLAGSQNDPWEMRKPPCIFPCGAVIRNGTWLITAGVNDLKSAWIEMPHESLLALMKPVRESAPTSLMIIPPTGLSKEEQHRAKLRANLVKARAVRALKRMNGSCPNNAEGAAIGTKDSALLERRRAAAAKARAVLAEKRRLGLVVRKPRKIKRRKRKQLKQKAK